MLKKILIPVDGSESSWKALEYAKNLAEKFGGHITVLTVAQIYYSAALVAMPLDNVFTSQEDDISLNSNMVITNAKEKMKDFTGSVSFKVEKGHPSEKILSVAKNEQADTIVIGSRGLSGIAEFFLGSVSAKVSEHSKVPVIIVK